MPVSVTVSPTRFALKSRMSTATPNNPPKPPKSGADTPGRTVSLSTIFAPGMACLIESGSDALSPSSGTSPVRSKPLPVRTIDIAPNRPPACGAGMGATGGAGGTVSVSVGFTVGTATWTSLADPFDAPQPIRASSNGTAINATTQPMPGLRR